MLASAGDVGKSLEFFDLNPVKVIASPVVTPQAKHQVDMPLPQKVLSILLVVTIQVISHFVFGGA